MFLEVISVDGVDEFIYMDEDKHRMWDVMNPMLSRCKIKTKKSTYHDRFNVNVEGCDGSLHINRYTWDKKKSKTTMICFEYGNKSVYTNLIKRSLDSNISMFDIFDMKTVQFV